MYWTFWSRPHSDKKAGQEIPSPREILSQAAKTLRYVPRSLITDKLRGYGAAKAEVLLSVQHLEEKYQTIEATDSKHSLECR